MLLRNKMIKSLVKMNYKYKMTFRICNIFERKDIAIISSTTFLILINAQDFHAWVIQRINKCTIFVQEWKCKRTASKNNTRSAFLYPHIYIYKIWYVIEIEIYFNIQLVIPLLPRRNDILTLLRREMEKCSNDSMLIK